MNDLNLNDPDHYNLAPVTGEGYCNRCAELEDKILGHEQDYDGTRFENWELKKLLQDVANWLTASQIPAPHDIISEMTHMGFLP